ncbi:AraC family transcriptional regulator [Clostridium estertheticum]|uniref:AraC family transcriptional regulator n=1 Tax=Clostridium estertheticum TaxID=238834 RepID=UPI001C0DFC11|nr:AraC family transcriptional regulator [Clostridium estertheticum]MBU3170332.1 AraC family transcriptional regulator [Clostridium estertheticum]
MKKISVNRFPMIVKFFFAFTLFLVIPLIITGIIFNYTMISYSENEIGSTAEINLKTVNNISVLFSTSILKDVARISQSDVLNNLSTVKNYNSIKSDANNVVKVTQVYTLLNEILASNYRITTIYVYIDGADYIITSNRGTVEMSKFNDVQWIKPYKEARSINLEPHWIGNRIISDRNPKTDVLQNENSNTAPVISYVYPLAPINSKVDGAIVVNMYEDELSKLINNRDLSGDGYIYITDTKGNIISHKNKSLVRTNISSTKYVKNILSFDKVSGYMIDNVDNEKKVITYYKSQFNDWIYVGIYPLANLMEKANKLSTKIILIIIFIIVLGLGFCYIVAKRLYNPLNKLVQDVKARNKWTDLKEDEMKLLSNAFSAMAREEDTMYGILENNKKDLKQGYILDLLKGNLQKYINSENQVEYDFFYENFICAIIAIDRFDEFLAKYSQEQQYYLKMLIINVCEGVINKTYANASVLFDVSKIAVIINMEVFSKDGTYKIVEELFKEVQGEILKVMDNTISVGIGECHSEKTGITLSYFEANEAIKRKILYGYGSVIKWKSSLRKDYKYFYPYNIEKHIFNYLNAGSMVDIDKEVKTMIEEIKAMEEISYDNITQIFNQLVGSTIKYLVDDNTNISYIYGSGYNIYQKLSSNETLEDIGLLLQDFYSRIILYKKKSTNESLEYMDIIEGYIKSNYHKDIDFEGMARYIGISYSYIRKIFKENTGKTIIEYTNRLRINEAKIHLRDTDKSLPEIASCIGYNNDQSLSRFFKKYEGITPGEYRTLNIKNCAK